MDLISSHHNEGREGLVSFGGLSLVGLVSDIVCVRINDCEQHNDAHACECDKGDERPWVSSKDEARRLACASNSSKYLRLKIDEALHPF